MLTQPTTTLIFSNYPGGGKANATSVEAQILWKKAKIMALLKQSYLWIHVYFFSKFSGIYLFSHSKHMPIANALDKKSSFLKLSLQIQEILQFFSMKMIDLMLHFWICLLKSD